jgi:hypothetical protein
MSKIGATARGIVTAKPRKESKRARGEGRATAVAAKVRATDRELLAIPKTEWAHAKAQERIVKLALRDGIEVAAREASRSTRTIRRMIARYQLSPTLLTFLPRKLGPA